MNAGLGGRRHSHSSVHAPVKAPWHESERELYQCRLAAESTHYPHVRYTTPAVTFFELDVNHAGHVSMDNTCPWMRPRGWAAESPCDNITQRLQLSCPHTVRKASMTKIRAVNGFDNLHAPVVSESLQSSDRQLPSSRHYIPHPGDCCVLHGERSRKNIDASVGGACVLRKRVLMFCRFQSRCAAWRGGKRERAAKQHAHPAQRVYDSHACHSWRMRATTV